MGRGTWARCRERRANAVSERLRRSLENMAIGRLIVGNSITVAQIHPMWLGFPASTSKSSELKGLILDQLWLNRKLMRMSGRSPLLSIANPTNHGMLHCPSRISLDLCAVPKWPHMKVVTVGQKLMENGLEYEMSLPMTMTDALIRRLEKACWDFQGICNGECDNLGWCDACWIAAGGGPGPQPGGEPDNSRNTGCEAAADNASD